MGGLHNKFPSYFYKRGNLFNTYLGYSEEPTALPKSKSPSKRHTNQPKAEGQNAKSSPLPSPWATTAVEEQAAFVKKHMSTAEAVRFLHLVAADCNVSLRLVEASGETWEKIAHLASAHLSEERTLRFLRVLEQRQEAGQALIQR